MFSQVDSGLNDLFARTTFSFALTTSNGLFNRGQSGICLDFHDEEI